MLIEVLNKEKCFLLTQKQGTVSWEKLYFIYLACTSKENDASFLVKVKVLL